ncbi:aromatic compound dioxygenase [Mycena vulgaris]|nr:aromatic compound dioxygenase [Mycena vulgaris]
MVNAFYSLLVAASALSTVAAHAEHAPQNWRRDNLAARSALETRCGVQLAARRYKRAAHALKSVTRKRGLHGNHRMAHRQTASNDSTCLITPEVTQGPYYILGEIVRQNITENQFGVPLEVSIDFVDISTCEPVQVWVDAWHANATGYYGGYITETGASISSGGGGGGDMANSSMSMGGMSMSGVGGGMSQTGASGAASTASATYGATSGADSVSAASQPNTATDDNSTFLRGVFQSDMDGHLTMYSIVSGWYSGRAQHFHIKAYPQGYIASNGTFVANSSALFFDDDTLTAVAATVPYANSSISWDDRVTNEGPHRRRFPQFPHDQWYPYQEAQGYNADMDITWVGSDITDGLLGSITVGLNMSFASIELSTQYAGFDVSSYASASMLPSASISVCE